MAKTKVSKLDKLQEANGKVETFEPTSLDQILGANPDSRFGTMDEGEYIKSLEVMDALELRQHAKANGLMAKTDNMPLLKQKLTDIFRGYVAQFRKPKQPTPSAPKPISKELAKILATGK